MRSETAVQQLVRLEHMTATGGTGQIWRNNSGAGMIVDEYGVERMVRWGLANDSKQLNDRIKSSDLIGITPVQITPAMVGYWLGVFTAYECKPEGWHLTLGDKRGLAQERFLTIVKESCGFGGFVTDPRDIYGVINRGR